MNQCAHQQSAQIRDMVTPQHFRQHLLRCFHRKMQRFRRLGRFLALSQKAEHLPLRGCQRGLRVGFDRHHAAIIHDLH